jgi:hypothetical protein
MRLVDVRRSGGPPRHIHEEDAMSKIINCDDGVVIRGDTDETLLANARQHLHDAHPGLDLSDDQLLGMAVAEEG